MTDDVIKKAMQTVYDRFFCPKTELFYEYVIDDENNAWHHLPSIEEINSLIPNPCGWGTGMEDSAMNGGTAIDALISLYEATKNRELETFIYAIYRGLMRCTVSEKNRGFVARSISPFDGKSHYTESSRDQYTHWIYGILRFYDSELCSDSQKEEITQALVNIAKKCKLEVTAENDYHMLREDGKIGIANKMWGDINTHEWFRLPMFYLSAFHVSGDNQWYEMYLKYRDEALEESETHNPALQRCYCSLQMQCSLRVVYDYDHDTKVRSRIKAIMEKNALYGVEKALKNSSEYCKPKHRNEINYRFRQWNKVTDPVIMTCGEQKYINPAQSERKDNVSFYPVREVAEGAIMAMLCPGFRPEDSLVDAVLDMSYAIDYKKHSSVYAPLLLSCAYFAIKFYK